MKIWDELEEPAIYSLLSNSELIVYNLQILLKLRDFSGLISRIKERGAMVKYCHQCSKIAKLEDQYCCDDCDHIDRIEVLILYLLFCKDLLMVVIIIVFKSFFLLIKIE